MQPRMETGRKQVRKWTLPYVMASLSFLTVQVYRAGLTRRGRQGAFAEVVTCDNGRGVVVSLAAGSPKPGTSVLTLEHFSITLRVSTL